VITDLIRARSKQKDLVIQYQHVFSSEAGKKVLADVCKRAGVLAVSHTKGDPHETAFYEGKRSLALFILSMLQIDASKLDEAIEMIEETE
jgi:hypothetical protein